MLYTMKAGEGHLDLFTGVFGEGHGARLSYNIVEAFVSRKIPR